MLQSCCLGWPLAAAPPVAAEMGKGQQALLQVPPVSPWWLWVGCPVLGQQLLWVTGRRLCCSRAVWGVLVPLCSQWAGTRPRISLGLPGPIPSQEHLILLVPQHSSLSAALVPAFPHFSLENVGTWSSEQSLNFDRSFVGPGSSSSSPCASPFLFHLLNARAERGKTSSSHPPSYGKLFKKPKDPHWNLGGRQSHPHCKQSRCWWGKPGRAVGQPCSLFPANQSGKPGAFSRLKSRLARRTGRNEALPAGPAEPFPSPSLPLPSHPFPAGPPSLQAALCPELFFWGYPRAFFCRGRGGQRSLPEFLSLGFAFHGRRSQPKVSPPSGTSACLDLCIPMTLHPCAFDPCIPASPPSHPCPPGSPRPSRGWLAMSLWRGWGRRMGAVI